MFFFQVKRRARWIGLKDLGICEGGVIGFYHGRSVRLCPVCESPLRVGITRGKKERVVWCPRCLRIYKLDPKEVEKFVLYEISPQDCPASA